ncbi:MAG: sigma-70 family RNA polymerase sigma factor [Desulfobacteraceae bacterium]|jgi:RNA polymerase sigma-70 factor (ECF subfamily)
MTSQSKPTKKIDQDSELVVAIQSGRQDLFTKLVERYQGALYNFGLKMCGESRDAEDMVQDTFLNVFKYLKGFRYETKFRNWLYRIASSICLKKKRKSKFAPDHELSLDDFMPTDETQAEQNVPAWASLPLEQVLNEELHRTLKSAILELPEKYRMVLVLRDVEGFSTEESAQILNLTAANIKVRLHRARLFLRDKLRSYFNDG